MQKVIYIKNIVWLLLLFLLGACAENSSKQKVSPEFHCQEQQMKNQYIAHWYNRQPSLETLDNVDLFIRENYNELRFVEPNYMIRIPENVNRINPNNVHSSKIILERIGALNAWNQGYRGQNTIVAVIDSGVDIYNRHLAQNIFKNPNEVVGNGIDDDENGYVDDVYGWNFTKDDPYVVDEIGHGTSIAGIITGSRGSDDSLAIAPRAKILPLDIMSGATGTEFDAKRAVDYALGMNARIINNSWSISCSEYLATAFAEYQKSNVIFVNSAGNVHQNVVVSQLMLASLSFSNFLNVGSTNILGHLSTFSGYGPSINIWAPGEQIPVVTSSDSWSTMTEASGTSVSAAIISGAAAVVWSAYPEDSAQKIISRMIRGAKRIEGRNFISLKDALPPLPSSPPTYDPDRGRNYEEPHDNAVTSPVEPLPQPILEPGGQGRSDSDSRIEDPNVIPPENSSNGDSASSRGASQGGTSEAHDRSNPPHFPDSSQNGSVSEPDPESGSETIVEEQPGSEPSNDPPEAPPPSGYDANLPETPHQPPH